MTLSVIAEMKGTHMENQNQEEVPLTPNERIREFTDFMASFTVRDLAGLSVKSLGHLRRITRTIGENIHLTRPSE